MADGVLSTAERESDRILRLEDVDGRSALREGRRQLKAGAINDARRWATAVVDLSDDLGTWSGAAGLLAQCPPTDTSSRTARVAVLGSSTTSQLASLLPLGSARAGLLAEVYEAPYGQYRQQILDA